MIFVMKRKSVVHPFTDLFMSIYGILDSNKTGQGWLSVSARVLSDVVDKLAFRKIHVGANAFQIINTVANERLAVCVPLASWKGMVTCTLGVHDKFPFCHAE